MKLGLENKKERWKAGVLGVLGAAALWLFYTNVIADSSGPAPRASGSTLAAAPAQVAESTGGGTLTGGGAPPPPRRGSTAGKGSDFRPRVPGGKLEDRVNAERVDPTLKLDLLARVQSVELAGGFRNIFQYGAAAPPPVPAGPIPKVPPIRPGPPVAMQPVTPPGPPPAPPPPPIPFKYYGYTSVKGESRKRAFFLDGEDIIVAWEGDMIKNRYKVVRVGLSSVEMEDTQFKNKQSLPMAEEVAG